MPFQEIQPQSHFIFQNQHLHPDDSRSESSGETISGDSGRGSNEEDAPNTSPSGKNLKRLGNSDLVYNAEW